jgi:hypothetical protein
MNIKPFSVISYYLEKRKEKKAQRRRELEKHWQEQSLKNEKNFNSHGFNNVKFPILLVEGDLSEGNNIFEFDNYELTVVWDLFEFSATNWYHSASMESEFKFIDNRGEIWDFKYNTDLGACTPGSLLKKLELIELKSFVTECINWRDQDEVKDAIQKANSISSLFEVIEKYNKSFL